MAFTFVVEDGTGLSTATSYATVAEADDYIIMNIHASSGWEELSTDSKERLLSWASAYLDSHTVWKGTKTVETSALRWPRTGVCDRDGIELGENEIPNQLKLATAEMSRYLIAQDRSLERDQDGLVRIKADVVELEFKEGYQLPQVPSHMIYMVMGLGYISGGMPRFARAVR